MRTRCPNCATVFRITAEQLRVRFGMVRCGQCQAVFNAFDSLIEGEVANLAPAAPPPSGQTTAQPPVVSKPHPVTAPKQEEVPPPLPKTIPAPPQHREPTRLDPIDVALAADETPEQSTRAVRDAGLAAVRELSETPGYDRWSAGAMEANADEGFYVEPARRSLWPFILAFLLLSLTLATQAAYYFRTDMVARFPDLAGLYQALKVDIPLPRHVELVAIEVSDLQSDKARNLLVLQSTLRNRAPYAQEWPLLELTLTDSNDEVVSRRILKSTDYLPAKADAHAFSGSSEVGLKLWLESKQPASGYRLFLFYP